MTLKVYSTLTNEKEEFKSIIPNHVGMYVCGPTVYGLPHMGHAKSYVCFDVVRRYFEYLGYKVKYVQNITDVGHLVGDADEGEDKIQKKSRLENLDPMEVAYYYETKYFEAMDKLNVLRPSISVRATGHIIEIIDTIKTLIEKGAAYVTDEGNVYFDITKFKDYGKLSGRKIGEGLSGERIEIAKDKRRNEDFSLWKKADETHLMKWASPWSVGYPGWHIECSVMSKKYLGDTFDIHGGGIDNMFPHHESEIAQSEVANGVKFVNYFMHNNLVTVGGKKMGKSLGNSSALEEVFKKVAPIEVRYYLLLNQYRRPTEFNIEAMLKNGEAYKEMCEVVTKGKEKFGVSDEITSDKVKEHKTMFLDAMDNDFNTALAISYLLKASKELSSELEKGEQNAKLISDYVNFFDKVANPILGLPFELENKSVADSDDSNSLTNQVIEELLTVRSELKKKGEYSLSDEIRNKLNSFGVEVKDSKDGFSFKIVNK